MHWGHFLPGVANLGSMDVSTRGKGGMRVDVLLNHSGEVDSSMGIGRVKNCGFPRTPKMGTAALTVLRGTLTVRVTFWPRLKWIC